MDVPVGRDEFTEIPAEDAFAILGNETRMSVLRTLWQADAALSFSDLRGAVAPEDTGNFNYHLEKLTDHFVRKTDEGYVLRFAGEQVVRAALSGTITSNPTIPPAEIDERCPYCDAPVKMGYQEETISVQCTDCGGVIDGEFPDGTTMYFEFPPAGLAGRDREGIIDAAHVLYDAKIAPMMKGVCPECAGRISISHDVCREHDPDVSGLCAACDTRFPVWSQFTCEHCRYSRRSPPWFVALNHPAVVAFYHEHGLSETLPFRKLTEDNARFVRDISTTVTDTDPYRFRVAIPVEDAALVVAMNNALTVLSVERTARDAVTELPTN